MTAIKVNASGASQISSRVCVPQKVSPETNMAMNDFPVTGYSCFAHRILGSPAGKHCESL